MRLRVAPRTSGITQNAHENEHPSWIRTNARTRSRRCGASTQPIAPTSPATNAAASSPVRLVTTTFSGAPANAFSRFEAHPVTYTDRAERAARAAACRDFETASCVTQQVLTTWISPASATSTCPSASNRSRIACASANETLHPRNRVENVAMRGQELRRLSALAGQRARRTADTSRPKWATANAAPRASLVARATSTLASVSQERW